MTIMNTHAKKTILATCIALLSVLGSSAQVSAPDGQVWWGYWNTTQPTHAALPLSSGTNDCAIRLVGRGTPELVDARVHGLRFCIDDKTAVRAARVWLASRQFGWPYGPDLAVKEVPVDSLRDLLHDGAPTEVLLDAPVDILPATNPYAVVFAGFTVEMKSNNAGHIVQSSTLQGVANTFFLGWESKYQSSGALALQLLVSNETMPPYGLAPLLPAEEPQLLAGQDNELTFTVRQEGTSAVHDFDCVVSVDGQPLTSQHVDLEKPLAEWGATSLQRLHFTLPQEARRSAYAVAVTQVNGQPNAGTVERAATMTTLSRRGVKRSVMEEFTGTWCANCPRGMVGMANLQRDFGDRFIGIAVHNDDPMAVPAYDRSAFKAAKMAILGGYPSCTIDRRYDCDPYLGYELGRHEFQTDDILAEALARPVPVDIALRAEWAEGQKVHCQAATTFHYSDTIAPYALALVLTADSLTGEGKAWMQVNNYYQENKNNWPEDLALFTGGTRLMPLAFDHVAIAVDGIDGGIEGSVTAPLEADVPQTFDLDFDMAGNVLMQDPTRLHAVALLLDTATGNIVNAVKTHVEGGAVAAVSDVPTDAVPRRVVFYDTCGRILKNVQSRGLYLEHKSDGSVVKRVRR